MERLLRKFVFYYREFLSANIGGKKVLILFILTYLVFGLMLFVTVPEIMSYAGGMRIFNSMPFGYSVEYANNLLSALGETGRHAYLYNQIPIDLFFPFLFGFGNCLLLAYLLNKLDSLHLGYIYLCLIPVFASWFDYLENLGILAMLNSYPNTSPFLIQFSNLFSVGKSLLASIYFVILFIVLVFVTIKWLRTSGQKS